MDRACSLHGEMKMSTKVWLESLEEIENMVDRGLDGWIILRWILGKYGFKDVDWIRLA